MSISPELFFQKGQFNNVDNVIISKPMKGTMPRGKTEAEDQQYYKTLQTSSKDRAENVMMVHWPINQCIKMLCHQGVCN